MPLSDEALRECYFSGQKIIYTKILAEEIVTGKLNLHQLKLTDSSASKEEIITFMKKFSPFQSVVTYILWHSYIERRNLKLE